MSDKQLDCKSIDFRIAFNYWYSKSKLINIVVIFITFIFLSISVGDIVFFNSKFHEKISILNALWACISLLSIICVNKYKGIGADIQELFDNYVFSLHSHSYITLRKDELDQKIKYAVSRKNRSITTPYYDELTSNITASSILNAQKSNINYDKNMRSKYLRINILSLIIYILLSILVGYILNLTVEKFLTTIILPSISMVSYYLKNSIQLYNEKSTIEYMSGSIDTFINKLSSNYNAENECKEYQSFIYFKRKTWTIIPDYIYKIDKKIINTKKVNDYSASV